MVCSCSAFLRPKVAISHIAQRPDSSTSYSVNSSLNAPEATAALNYVEQLRQSVNGLSLSPGVRGLAAGICFGIAHAIILLLEKGLFASAFALVRRV